MPKNLKNKTQQWQKIKNIKKEKSQEKIILMEFVFMVVAFIVGLVFLVTGTHLKKQLLSKTCYIVGAFGVLLAMYIAWPK
ncbi:hypothetical protein [Companilactobacillus furfuricola]|uniref:hypothetical protein n=1 Tax=Companilactobacillus furfuricola TaxID=1462575 RepID=UPI0013DE3764|nr:hypothetical protein [Companilactobacillus furfuricola]